jgi:hypothetical protein
MKWKIFSLCLLLLLSSTVGLLSYTTRPVEKEKLLLWANKFGIPPKNYVSISELPWGKQIWALANASMLTHTPIEITEDSPLREWAESMLINDDRAEVDVKVGEEYYAIGIGYFPYVTFPYPRIIAIALSILTACAWITYAGLLLEEVSKRNPNR